MMGYQEFTLFPLLPAEIRLQIWEVVAAVPYTLSLSCKTPKTTSETPQWFSPSPVPALLSVNSESRHVALSIYTLLVFPRGLVKPPSRPLYINFSCDAISLARGVHSRYARTLLEDNAQIRDKLKRIALEETTWGLLNTLGALPGPVMDSGWDCWGCSMDTFSVTAREFLESLEEVRFHGEDVVGM